MDKNDINSNYTMADAVFTACFLNACLRHADTVGMANFSPIVNTVGAIFTHEEGIVLRPTYHVFDLYTNHTYEDIVHSALISPSFEVPSHLRSTFVYWSACSSNRHGRTRCSTW